MTPDEMREIANRLRAYVGLAPTRQDLDMRAGADALDALARVLTRLDHIEELNADRIPTGTKDASKEYWTGAKDACDYTIQAVRLAISRDPHGDTGRCVMSPDDLRAAAEFDRMIEVVKAEARAEERKRLAREIRAEAIGPRRDDLATTYIWYAGRRAGLQWAETIVCGQREDT